MNNFRYLLGTSFLLCINAAPQGLDHLFPGQSVLSADEAIASELLGKHDVLSTVEVRPPQEVSSQQVDYMNEVYKKQLVESIEEILNKQELSSVSEVNAKEVSAQEVDVTPVQNVQEVISLEEVISKIEVPDNVAKKFLQERARGNKFDFTAMSDSYEPGPMIDEVEKKIEIMDKQLVSKLQEIKNLEELISKLEVIKLEEVLKMEEVKRKEEIKRLEEVKRMEDVKRMEEVMSKEEVSNMNEVKSISPVAKIEEIERVIPLSDDDVYKLRKMIAAAGY